LPPFARPTHGEPGSSLQAFKKIRHYIKDIPRGATQHVTSDRFPRGPRLPFSDDEFAKTLTCSGGVGNYHPSGLRLYTIREAASLQTFPISHTFTPDSKTKARRQIGNAVPPLLARSMYREIIKCLKESDRVEGLSEEGQT
jgi:DNA (cytosine-5)-methyltransferase 1